MASRPHRQSENRQQNNSDLGYVEGPLVGVFGISLAERLADKCGAGEAQSQPGKNCKQQYRNQDVGSRQRRRADAPDDPEHCDESGSEEQLLQAGGNRHPDQ